MAVKSYSEAEFKAFVKTIFDRLRCLPDGVFIDDTDIDNAFDWATAQLGYGIPDQGDTQSPEKLKWLDNRMRAYTYNLLFLSYANISDCQKSKSRQIVEGFKKLRDGLDKDFDEGYIDISQGVMVRGSGFVNDRFGEDISYAGLEPIDMESGTVEGIDN